MDELKEIYRANKTIFEKRLRSFKKVWTQGSDIKIFYSPNIVCQYKTSP